jgi:hypothetical protein
MFNKAEIALAAALILSVTSASFANGQGRSPGASQSEQDFWEWQHTLSRNHVEQGVPGHARSAQPGYGAYDYYPDSRSEELNIWIQDRLYRESNGE